MLPKSAYNRHYTQLFAQMAKNKAIFALLPFECRKIKIARQVRTIYKSRT